MFLFYTYYLIDMLLNLVMLLLFKEKQDVESQHKSLSTFLSQDGVMEEDVLFVHRQIRKLSNDFLA